MAVNKVDLTVSQIVNDLNSGMTWLKKDDLGYGSIESKYGAIPAQIAAIRKHPALKDAETTITIFNIIDDTTTKTNEKKNSTPTQESSAIRSTNKMEQPVVSVDDNHAEVGVDTSEAADIFANL
jgi:hypothetical protein